MLHHIATHTIDHLAGARAAFPTAVVWAAPDLHLHAQGTGAAQGFGALMTSGSALFCPAVAMLLVAVAVVGRLFVMSSDPMASAMNHAAVVWAGTVPNPHMDPHGLPGGSAASKIVGGLMFYGLLACAAAIVLGVMAFTAGKILTNHYAGVTGRIAVMAGIIGAVFIGGCMTLVNWAFNLGATFTPQ
jgi:hypothetical protein